LGGNINLISELCEKTREEAFDIIVDHGQQIGANAIVSLCYDPTELMDSVTEVLCYGVPVVVEKV